MNKLQLFMLMQAQVLVIRTGMELTRMVKPFRTRFKQMVGLPARANNLEVLKMVGVQYINNGIGQEFWDYINKPSSLYNGQPLVTPEMLQPYLQ